MFWHITGLKFRISLVLKFIFDLSPFYVEELVREKKHSSLPWLAYYDSLKNFSLRPFARTMFSSERRNNLPPLQNAAIQIYLLAFTEDLGFKTLRIKFTPGVVKELCYASLLLLRKVDLQSCLLMNLLIL